jgi:hypothetical protein
MEQAYVTTGYRDSNLKHRRSFSNAGSDDTAENESSEPDSLYTSIAQLERTGDLMFPVDVLIRFTDGEEIMEKWDGKERFKDYVYTGKREIEWVKIDPDSGSGWMLTISTIPDYRSQKSSIASPGQQNDLFRSVLA